MTKSELIRQVAIDANMTLSAADHAVNALMGAIHAVNALMGAITMAMRNGEDVTLQGFGTFSIKQREARTGRNPATGATIQIPASKTVGFKAGKTLKDAVA